MSTPPVGCNTTCLVAGGDDTDEHIDGSVILLQTRGVHTQAQPC